MDIDKQIASLEENTVFKCDSPKLMIIKFLGVFISGLIISYLLKPMTIVQLQYDPETQGCGYKIIKKRFLILSIIMSIIIFFIASKFKIF
jgi:hypothetical protein